MGKAQRAVALGLVVALGLMLIYVTNFTMQPFGSFPQRQVNEYVGDAVGQQYLEDALWQTGATNVVTSVVWGYRAYDTLGESTVLFTAVVGVIMLFRTLRRDD